MSTQTLTAAQKRALIEGSDPAVFGSIDCSRPTGEVLVRLGYARREGGGRVSVRRRGNANTTDHEMTFAAHRYIITEAGRAVVA